MGAETFTKVTKLLADICATDSDSIESDVPLPVYGLDSLRAFELAILIEDAFAIRMRTEAMDKLRRATVADLVQFVDRTRRATVPIEPICN